MKQLNYSGDVREGALGAVVGPTTYGELLTVYAVEYDAETDTTVAHLRPSTQGEVEASRG
jgi:hypothetical protein